MTTTLVDFTEATASTPGSNPSSSTASEDIGDTIRCGPTWISTLAITWRVIADPEQAGRFTDLEHGHRASVAAEAESKQAIWRN